MEKIKINSSYYNFIESNLSTREKIEKIFEITNKGEKIGIQANNTYYVLFRDGANLYVRVFITEELAKNINAPANTWIRYGVCKFDRENIEKIVETLCAPLPF